MRATSRRYSGLPWLTPTTSEPMSSSERRNSPVSTLSMWAVESDASSTAPEGMPRFAADSVAFSPSTSTPRSRMRTGSSQTCTARPGPPIVCTSRVPGHALEFGLERARDAFQVVRRQHIAAPERHGQHRHVVDALGLDDRWQRTQIARQPVLVRVEHVIQAHQRFGARHADLELHRQHGQPRPRHRIGVLDTGDLRQHLFGRPRHHVLHIGAARSRKSDQHVGHGHVDLRLFLPRRDQHGEQAQQQCHDRQQRRDGIGLERSRDAARNAQAPGGGRSNGNLVLRHGRLRAQSPAARRRGSP